MAKHSSTVFEKSVNTFYLTEMIEDMPRTSNHKQSPGAGRRQPSNYKVKSCVYTHVCSLTFIYNKRKRNKTSKCGFLCAGMTLIWQNEYTVDCVRSHALLMTLLRVQTLSLPLKLFYLAVLLWKHCTGCRASKKMCPMIVANH